MHVDIIGAGPVGGYVAYLLAVRGFEVHLYEDHPEIGKPIQCTGLMTMSMHDVVEPLKDFLVNTTNAVDVHAPNGESFEIRSKEYIVDRTRFDTHFVNKAIAAGAVLHRGYRFTGVEGGFLTFTTVKGITKIKKNILIGADGANSSVAKLINTHERTYCVGIQARVRGHFDPSRYSVYFGNDISPGFFAWIVPESKTVARVGLKGTGKNFEGFLARFGFESIEMQAGPIPIYDPHYVTAKNDIYLVGDAATQVKATTAGGIIPGLKAAECLADALEHGSSYERLWKKRIGRDLWLHLKIRQLMDMFSDADWNYFISLLRRPSIVRVFEKYDRERPFQLMRVLIQEPRLLAFGIKVFFRKNVSKTIRHRQ